MPGRKAKPTALRIAQGNPSGRPLNRNEPKFSTGLACPTFLTSSAKREWERVVKELQAVDLLKSTDRASLAAYCLAWARWRSAEELVTKDGQLLEEPILSKGAVVGRKFKRNPATAIARDERTAMLRAASLFGFDPSSRSRLTTGQAVEAEDPFLKFMRDAGVEEPEPVVQS